MVSAIPGYTAYSTPAVDDAQLTPQRRREATKVPGGERRDGLTNTDPARLEAD
jgi:hypothetical protein